MSGIHKSNSKECRIAGIFFGLSKLESENFVHCLTKSSPHTTMISRIFNFKLGVFLFLFLLFLEAFLKTLLSLKNVW